MAAPLVSIFMFCMDRKTVVSRAIDSVLAQTYPNIEIVVQDGASTDGTREILEAYGDKIKLVSEPDSGNNEAFHRVLRRCQGTYWGSCLSDEELLPDAVERAVVYMEAHPDADAITGDADIINFEGRVIGQHISDHFALRSYLTGDYCPYFVSSFFRRQAMLDIDVMGQSWNPNCIEFEIWCRLGTTKSIHYVSGKFGRYGIHPGQLSNIPKDIDVHMDGRVQVIERLFAPGGPLAGLPGDGDILKYNLLARQCAMQFNHMVHNKLPAQAARYLELLLLFARRLARHWARENGRAYDDDRVVAALAANLTDIFSAQAAVWLQDVLPFPASSGGTMQDELAPVSFPETAPTRVVMPPLDPALYAKTSLLSL